MLTCDICGEEILFEEDMKTHILLSHVENDMHCPLCSLSGVSYDELCFHISSAHPEEQQISQTVTHLTSTSTGTSASMLPEQSSSPGSGCVPPVKTSAISTKKTRQTSASHCNNDINEPKPEHKKAKQQTQLSTKNELFTCPLCGLVCSSSFLLQEHVELHLEEKNAATGQSRLECPVCSVVCSDDDLLQKHVELHLDHAAGSPVSDLELARQLQQQEEEQRRKQEEAQEEREFKKLQKQFGLDGSGGYGRQMEKTMERAVARGLLEPAEFHCKRAEMMASLASGVDDCRTRTQGVVRTLNEYYQTAGRECAHVWLSADTDHYCSSQGDKGWGCGYRNFQMLLSCLHSLDKYSPVLQDKAVHSIPRLQNLIEEAWQQGLDPQGASHFNQRLQGTRAWIGATEIYCLLTSLQISARIIDFHQPTGPSNTHPRLFEWVKHYFCQTSDSSRLPPRVVQTTLPPLYLQHQGHSRTVVGLEQRKNGSLCLLVLDPGSTVSDMRKLMSRDSVATAIRHIRKFPSSLKHKQYQVVAVQGVLSAEEKQISISNSGTLCAERIP
ncbi:zinc finger-containing ubiquitin peptidase 1 [Cynoglossus semilaevis]|uniref:Zinc finger-containing ubiquitin peptidase 1 n=1 Tax=Cynoglossus semilaevis TaxID=244447 RepID=A0A3P8VPU5_CYNSE|nr:zinc finger with UFM1-specific peptidase domain protein [Cynoglossus semilaevis]XP_008322090.1 zinc finger with UFM1-specific peptidase domain protein [Cynoglossus semilaevis]